MSQTHDYSRSSGNQGIGFAIPANLAREVMQSLRGKGRVVRGYIGTSVQTLTPEIADAMKLKGQQTGALVGGVEPNAPAAKAGIKTGDVITAVNGKKVNDPRELRLMIGSMAPGTKAHVEINREGQTKTFDVKRCGVAGCEIRPSRRRRDPGSKQAAREKRERSACDQQEIKA